LTIQSKSLKWYNERTLSKFYESLHKRGDPVRLPHYDVVYVRAAIRANTGIEYTYEQVYNAMVAEGWSKD
jgi:hypothetical protein